MEDQESIALLEVNTKVMLELMEVLVQEGHQLEAGLVQEVLNNLLPISPNNMLVNLFIKSMKMEQAN